MDLIQTYIHPHDSSAWNDLHDMAMQNPLILHDHHVHQQQLSFSLVSTNELNFRHPLQTPPYNLTSSSIQAPITSPPTSTFSNIITIDHEECEDQEEELGAMKEMMYKIAAMQPVDIDPATIRKPKRRNVRISEEPQSVAARHRRERISERIRILQRLVPGGTKMDTATMLDEAIRYVKFLKRQVHKLQSNNHVSSSPSSTPLGRPISTTTTTTTVDVGSSDEMLNTWTPARTYVGSTSEAGMRPD
ncbi:hypothetical protein Sjap_018480 [Stephania japonica]|uniref:BHLH domain-containing protein n=1 Tax=Stephania japonica TaxID=461633 RepID=A0AAP0I851_9MAGN